MKKIIDKVSSCIRTDIASNKKPSPWPFHPTDVESAFNVPEHLERFLLGLLTGDPDERSPSQRVASLIKSFSQDIVYAVTRGEQKPPKHWLLPYAVKTLTGNIEIIQTLNRLGHAVSYSQLEENNTALCLQKMAASLNQEVVLPASLKPNVFTNLAWDNIDRLEESMALLFKQKCMDQILKDCLYLLSVKQNKELSPMMTRLLKLTFLERELVHIHW